MLPSVTYFLDVNKLLQVARVFTPSTDLDCQFYQLPADTIAPNIADFNEVTDE